MSIWLLFMLFPNKCQFGCYSFYFQTNVNLAAIHAISKQMSIWLLFMLFSKQMSIRLLFMLCSKQNIFFCQVPGRFFCLFDSYIHPNCYIALSNNKKLRNWKKIFHMFKCYCEEQFFVTESFYRNLVLKGAAETACWQLANTLKLFGLENSKKSCLFLMLLTVLHVNNFKAPPLPWNWVLYRTRMIPYVSLHHQMHTSANFLPKKMELARRRRRNPP